MKPPITRRADPGRLIAVAPGEALFALASAWWAAESSGEFPRSDQESDLGADHGRPSGEDSGTRRTPPTDFGPR
jgi:hypothetical protein